MDLSTRFLTSPQFERQPRRRRRHVRAAAAATTAGRPAVLYQPVGPVAGALHDPGAPGQRGQRHAGRLPPADAAATTGMSFYKQTNISPVDCCAFSAVFRFIDINRKRTTIDEVR